MKLNLTNGFWLLEMEKWSKQELDLKLIKAPLIQLLHSQVKYKEFISLQIMLQFKCKESLLKDSLFGQFIGMMTDLSDAINTCKDVMPTTAFEL